MIMLETLLDNYMIFVLSILIVSLYIGVVIRTIDNPKKRIESYTNLVVFLIVAILAPVLIKFTYTLIATIGG